MRKHLFLLIILISHFHSFGQTFVITNPSVPNPRPTLTQDEILHGKLRDFNHIKTDKDHQLKPTGTRQRMIASSRLYSHNVGATILADSERYSYSAYKGSAPNSLIGNMTTTSLFDTAYHVMPGFFGYTQGGFPYQSYLFNSDNLFLQFNGFDSTKTLVQTKWNDYYANDSIAKTKIANYKPDSSWISIRESFYDTSGKLTKDSTTILSEIANNQYQVEYYLKNIFNDNLGRVAHIDSSYYALYQASNFLNKVIIKNTYNSSASVFPDKDSVFVLSYNINQGTIDTNRILINDYLYDASNRIIQATHYSLTENSMQQLEVTPVSKDIYTYNSDGQILTLFQRTYVDTSFEDNQKEEYQYEHKINTSYILSYSDWISWHEQIKSVSTLNADYIIDSVNTYLNGERYSLYSVIINDFKNVTQANYFDFPSSYSDEFFNSYNYYYEEFNDPSAVSTVKKNQLGVQIFPNPSSNTLNYNVDAASGKSLAIFIYNITGNLLYQNNFKSNSGKINLSNFKCGTYIFEAANLSDGSSKKIKFVKE